MTLSRELIDLLAQLADQPDTTALQNFLQAALGERELLPERRWTEFPALSVVALVLWQADEHQKALGLAQRTIAQNGRDDAAMAVLSAAREMFYVAAMQALHHKRPDMARNYLEANIRLFQAWLDVGPEGSLLRLMDHVAAAATPGQPLRPPEGRPTVLNLSIWGERFIAAAERTILPCCLAPGNFPALKAHGTIYLRIHTRAEDAARISDLPVIKALAEHACIDVQIIPETLLRGTHLSGGQFWTRLLIAALGYADLMFARSLDADLIFGGADVLVASRAYSEVKRRLISGYRAVVMQPVRGMAGEVERLVERKGCRRPDGSLDIPGETLYWASLKAIHPLILHSFMRQPPTSLPVDPVQFYFTMPDGFALHTYQMSILGLAARYLPPDIGCDYHTYDTRLLSDLLVGTDRDAACYMDRRMPSEIYVVGLDEGGDMAAYGKFELTPPASVQSIQKWVARPEDVEHFRWAIQQRFEYPLPPDVRLDFPTDCRDEAGAIAEVTALLDANRSTMIDSIASYRR